MQRSCRHPAAISAPAIICAALNEIEQRGAALDTALSTLLPHDEIPARREFPSNSGITDSATAHPKRPHQRSGPDFIADMRDHVHGTPHSSFFMNQQYPCDRSSRKMDQGYTWPMDIDEKDRLARSGDMGLEACAIRLIAARLLSGATQKDLADQVGVKKTTWNNMEAGLSYPSRPAMRLAYRTLRLDFNFMMNGDWAQLPADLHARLFECLALAEHEWDRKRGSDQSQAEPRIEQ